jgi:hypothetical protein
MERVHDDGEPYRDEDAVNQHTGFQGERKE